MCNDDWDTSDAEVVCRQLGYPTSDANTAYFGQGTGPIWLDIVQCTGSETHLVNCTNSGIGRHNCGHNQDIGVNCLGMLTCMHSLIILCRMLITIKLCDWSYIYTGCCNYSGKVISLIQLMLCIIVCRI